MTSRSTGPAGFSGSGGGATETDRARPFGTSDGCRIDDADGGGRLAERGIGAAWRGVDGPASGVFSASDPRRCIASAGGRTGDDRSTAILGTSSAAAAGVAGAGGAASSASSSAPLSCAVGVGTSRAAVGLASSSSARTTVRRECACRLAAGGELVGDASSSSDDSITARLTARLGGIVRTRADPANAANNTRAPPMALDAGEDRASLGHGLKASGMGVASSKFKGPIEVFSYQIAHSRRHHRLPIVASHVFERHVDRFVRGKLQRWPVNVGDRIEPFCRQ